MKIYTHLVMDWDGNVLEEKSYDYHGPIAECTGGSSGDSETSSEAIPWQGVQPYLESGYGKAANLYGTQGAPGYFPGQTYVNRNPLENAAQGMSLDYAMNQMPGQIWDAQKAQFEMLNAPDVANNQYVNNMIEAQQNLLNRNFTENLLPAVRAGALSAGQVGGSGQEVFSGIAARGTQEALANAAAQTQLGAYGEGLMQQGRGMAFAPSTMQMGLAPYQQMGAAGEYARSADEMALQDAMARWNYEQQAPFSSVQNELGLYTGTPWGSLTTSDADSGGGLTGALGGAAAGAGIGSALELSNPWTAGLAVLGGGLGLFG